MKKKIILVMVLCLFIGLITSAIFIVKSLIDINNDLNLNDHVKVATETTIDINNGVYQLLEFDNELESQLAKQGLIDAPSSLVLTNDDGDVIWSQDAYDFIDNYMEASGTVNPSLFMNTKNNHQYGLFKVMDGIYQVRGYDLSNLTLIESENGWIVFDCCMSVECSKAAMQLVHKNLGERPIVAIVISHSHVDHFGGIKGLINEDDVADRTKTLEEQLKSGKVPIIVPSGFEEHAVSENVYAGTAMSRRAQLQYGVYLSPSMTGNLGIGLGMQQSVGTISYISPTVNIYETGETYIIDGVKMEFQMTPGSEAPSEMNTWFPELNALWMAENCTSTMHNLYTLRGAEIRDGTLWSRYICESITRYGKDVEVVFQSHNWPHYGNQLIREYLENTAAMYKYINDQTLTYINQGYTSDEISNMMTLPYNLERNWYTRQYYGTLSHNAKAVYQKYMGWYDGNPVNLNPLTPEESARKWVQYMNLGSVKKVLKQAKKDFDQGEYQWVAEITNTIIFDNPNHADARLLCADALEQLGYQCESGTWRNSYLTAAKELREGNLFGKATLAEYGNDIQLNMSAINIFDFIGILVNKTELAEYDFKWNVKLVDTQEKLTVQFKYGAVLIYQDTEDEQAELSITCTKNALFFILVNQPDLLEKHAIVEGNQTTLELIMSLLNEFDFEQGEGFNIVVP